MAKVGRPTDYNDDIAVKFCASIAMGNSLRATVMLEGMPCHTTIYKWFNLYPEFVSQYARAKEDSADSRADQIEEIAEKVLTGKYDPAAARVAIDAFKWTSGKHKPKKYGDRITTEHAGTISLSDMTDEQLDQKLQAIINAGT